MKAAKIRRKPQRKAKPTAEPKAVVPVASDDDLRNQFAAAALNGITAGNGMFYSTANPVTDSEGNVVNSRHRVAALAWEIADLMLQYRGDPAARKRLVDV